MSQMEREGVSLAEWARLRGYNVRTVRAVAPASIRTDRGHRHLFRASFRDCREIAGNAARAARSRDRGAAHEASAGRGHKHADDRSHGAKSMNLKRPERPEKFAPTSISRRIHEAMQLLPAVGTILIVGPAGIGKSAAIADHCQSNEKAMSVELLQTHKSTALMAPQLMRRWLPLGSRNLSAKPFAFSKTHASLPAK